MGKKQHQKDRMFLTTKEWKEEWGGFKEKKSLPFQRLPFYCCAITFTPFEDAVCAPDGTVFDVTNIVPYLQKHHKHPVSGDPLALEDLIPLTFHKNTDGEYHCPVLNEVFTPHTHIVAIRTSGHVYCYKAIQELNIKIKSWRDLITDDAFTRGDIIHIQDPSKMVSRTLESFDHVQHALSADDGAGDDDDVIRNANPTLQKVMAGLRGSDASDVAEPTSRRALALAKLEAAIQAKRKAACKTDHAAAAAVAAKQAAAAKGTGAAGGGESSDEDDWRLRGPEARPRAASFKPGTSTWDTDDQREAERKIGKKALAEAQAEANAARAHVAGRPDPQAWWQEHYKPRYEVSVETTGHASRGLTSTTFQAVTKNERVRRLIHRNPAKKAYLQLLTSKGALNVELHCDIAPRTCENFLALAEMGYYTGTVFHRSIRNFMVQGGDPTGTGKGGTSIYGPTFQDEMDNRLVHDGRFVMGMANSGKNTNASQFYILYKSARHLDFKHTVFGRVVGGFETLTAIENVKTDAEDRPLQAIKITGLSIYQNPYREMMAEEEQKEAKQREQDEHEQKGIVPESERVGRWYSNPKEAARLITRAGNGEQRGSAGAKVETGSPGARAAKRKHGQTIDEFDAW